MQALLTKIESVGGVLGLLFIVVAAIVLKLTGNLDTNVVSVLQWAGSSFMAAQAASHIGAGMTSPPPSSPTAGPAQ